MCERGPLYALRGTPRHGIDNAKSLAAKYLRKAVGGIAPNEQNTLGTEVVWLLRKSRDSSIQEMKMAISPTMR